MTLEECLQQLELLDNESRELRRQYENSGDSDGDGNPIDPDEQVHLDTIDSMINSFRRALNELHSENGGAMCVDPTVAGLQETDGQSTADNEQQQQTVHSQNERGYQPAGDNAYADHVAGVGESILGHVGVSRENLSEAADSYVRGDVGGALYAVNPLARIRDTVVEAYEEESQASGPIMGALNAVDALNPVARIRDHVAEAYEDGSRTDGMGIGVLQAIDSVNPFANIRDSLAATGDAIERGDAHGAGRAGTDALLGSALLVEGGRSMAAATQGAAVAQAATSTGESAAVATGAGARSASSMEAATSGARPAINPPPRPDAPPMPEIPRTPRVPRDPPTPNYGPEPDMPSRSPVDPEAPTVPPPADPLADTVPPIRESRAPTNSSADANMSTGQQSGTNQAGAGQGGDAGSPPDNSGGGSGGPRGNRADREGTEYLRPEHLQYEPQRPLPPESWDPDELMSHHADVEPISPFHDELVVEPTLPLMRSRNTSRLVNEFESSESRPTELPYRRTAIELTLEDVADISRRVDFMTGGRASQYTPQLDKIIDTVLTGNMQSAIQMAAEIGLTEVVDYISQIINRRRRNAPQVD